MLVCSLAPVLTQVPALEGARAPDHRKGLRPFNRLANERRREAFALKVFIDEPGKGSQCIVQNEGVPRVLNDDMLMGDSRKPRADEGQAEGDARGTALDIDEVAMARTWLLSPWTAIAAPGSEDMAVGSPKDPLDL